MRFHWDPFRAIDALSAELNQAFTQSSSATSVSATWTPAVDVFEQDGGFVLQAELAGLGRDDIELNVEDRTLTLKGERKPAKEVKAESFHRNERPVGRFTRVFNLPTSVDRQKINASFKD